VRAAAAAPGLSQLTQLLAPAAKNLTAREPGDPPAFIGPLNLSAGAAWEAELGGHPADEYHFIYVCRKRTARK
jgi:hypothetical protein